MDRGMRKALVVGIAVIAVFVIAMTANLIYESREKERHVNELAGAMERDAERAAATPTQAAFNGGSAFTECRKLFEASPDGIALRDVEYDGYDTREVSADLYYVSVKASAGDREVAFSCTSLRDDSGWAMELL